MSTQKGMKRIFLFSYPFSFTEKMISTYQAQARCNQNRCSSRYQKPDHHSQTHKEQHKSKKLSHIYIVHFLGLLYLMQTKNN